MIMRVRLLQRIGLLDLTNRTQFKKGNGYKIRTKSVRDYWGMRLMLHTPYIHYWYTNVDLLIVSPLPRRNIMFLRGNYEKGFDHL